MNVQFIQSWRRALLIAAIVTIGISGYKAVFGPDAATRIAQTRLLPGGQPSQNLLSRQVAAASPFVSAQITLGQLIHHMQSLNYDITWELVDAETFLMRAEAENALTREQVEIAIQFVALNGPEKDGKVIGVFTGPAVGIDSMAYNRVTMSEEETVQFVLSILSAISPVPLQ